MTVLSRVLNAGQVAWPCSWSEAQVWEVRSGALCLQYLRREGPQFLGLWLPGDRVHAPSLGMDSSATQVCAVIPTVIDEVAWPAAAQDGEGPGTQWLGWQMRLIRLRTGATADRLEHLLGMLSEASRSSTGGSAAMPTLKQMAAIIDSTPETVCRLLGGKQGRARAVRYGRWTGLRP